MTYDYDRRTAANYGVGFTWQSDEGVKRIDGETTTRSGEPAFVILKENSRFPEIVAQKDIAREVLRDTKNFEFRKRQRDEAAQEVADTTERESWLGFTDKMTPTGRRRAIDVLGKNMTISRGGLAPRGEHIIRLVRDGYRVTTHPSWGLMLQHPSNKSFFLEKDLTKIGLAFAEYLVRNHKV